MIQKLIFLTYGLILSLYFFNNVVRVPGKVPIPHCYAILLFKNNISVIIQYKFRVGVAVISKCYYAFF